MGVAGGRRLVAQPGGLTLHELCPASSFSLILNKQHAFRNRSKHITNDAF